jgi:hypothetical protein
MLLKRRPQGPETIPADKGAQEINAVGRMNLSLDRGANRRLATSIDK